VWYDDGGVVASVEWTKQETADLHFSPKWKGSYFFVNVKGKCDRLHFISLSNCVTLYFISRSKYVELYCPYPVRTYMTTIYINLLKPSSNFTYDQV
jgi:hypothetical protein